MSKDIIVLTPNGRRQKIQCTPDTSILQVLEDACQKQGFQPSDYDLKYHNHILDLTTTIRFSNVPNKATLEMVEAERKREELSVTIGLLLEDGERRTADVPPHTSLYDLIMSLAPTELQLLPHPSILYMRQEVTGIPALREKTLRQLGLIKGRAILRLLNKADEARQANVSAIYRRPFSDSGVTKNADTTEELKTTTTADEISIPGPSDTNKKAAQKPFDPIKLIKHEKLTPKEEVMNTVADVQGMKEEIDNNTDSKNNQAMEVDINKSQPKSSTSSNTSISQEILERRLKIEEEVTFLGTQKAIAFMQPDEIEDELEDLPDEFYELTIEEVRRLYSDMQQYRMQLENTPLITSAKREEHENQTSKHKLNTYKNVVVRIQFPDRIILQGVFTPTNTIEDINNFIKEHLETPNKPFHIYTTPLKETLDPKMTLLEAKFVPCVHMHFKWVEDDTSQTYLKEQIYSKKTTSDAASILASKYRAPSRRKIGDTSDNNDSAPSTSTTRNSKVPKWFKN